MTPAEALSLLAPCGTAIAWIYGTLSKRIARLEAHLDDCNERWAREVRRGAALAGLPAVEGPSSLPPPEWEESTAVRDMRAELEAQGLKETLRRYVSDEITPPRRKLPSRPR